MKKEVHLISLTQYVSYIWRNSTFNYVSIAVIAHAYRFHIGKLPGHFSALHGAIARSCPRQPRFRETFPLQ